jgi:phosphotransferase system HPr (HPr) family protein
MAQGTTAVFNVYHPLVQAIERSLATRFSGCIRRVGYPVSLLLNSLRSRGRFLGIVIDDVAKAIVELKNRFGLHVRTASMVAKAAIRFRSRIWLSDEHQHANARSVVEMTSLGTRRGR